MGQNDVLAGAVLRDPTTLKNHPLNIEIFGEDFPDWLIQSISDRGIREPIVVCKSSNPVLNGVIVSGRTRRAIAIKLGMSKVPTVDWECDSELDFKLEMITRNVRRELTIEQRARMFEVTKQIQAEKAALRMEHKDTTSEKGTSSQAAAKTVGMSRTTAEKASRVVKAIDKLNGEGRKEEAEKVRDGLNKSVAKGESVAKEVLDGPIPEPEPPQNDKVTRCLQKVVDSWATFQTDIRNLVKEMDKKNREDSQFAAQFSKLEGVLTEITEHLEYPGNQINRLSAEWKKTLKFVGAEK